MICCECKKDFPLTEMIGRGQRYCNKCFEIKSDFMKGRIVALNGLRSLPLEAKIIKTKMLVSEAIEEFGIDYIYLSYSGGKDSTVLSNIIRQEYPDITHIFSNTTNEYPETIKHLNWEKDENGMNLTIVYPRDRNGKAYNFKRVVKEYGYPLFTKRVSNAIRTYRRAKSERTKSNSQGYILRNFKKYDQFKTLNISDLCCDKLKTSPIKKYAKKMKLECAIIATLSEESKTRKADWLNFGCNIFHIKKDNQCRPLSFWTEDDIYEYIEKYNIKIPDLYQMGYTRNGCMFCGFGIEYESKTGLNRFERLSMTHPKMHDYLTNNFSDILDKCNIKY